jgi:hypothetical protein
MHLKNRISNTIAYGVFKNSIKSRLKALYIKAYRRLNNKNKQNVNIWLANHGFNFKCRDNWKGVVISGEVRF